MWMGGKAPLGYDVRDRKLVVNEAEAARVGACSRGSRRPAPGWRPCGGFGTRASPQGAGGPSNRGDVYKLLNNRTYVGEVAHKGHVYPGEHEAIVTGSCGTGRMRSCGSARERAPIRTGRRRRPS